MVDLNSAAREKESCPPEKVPAPQLDERGKNANIESELITVRAENGGLRARVQAGESRIAQLEQQIKTVEGGPAIGSTPEVVSTADLQAQLVDAKKQLDGAERENALLFSKIGALQERPSKQKPRNRPAAAGDPGIRGAVLAVNRAYNFVVLNLGGRQGVEPNTEMLVVRGGTFIGKIRVSSVEPATTIGDIITTSLARGVQVQPGDVVIYAGTNF